jgi:hypothetical protein
MQELSASGADRSQLAVQFAAIGEELTDLWRRTETAERSRP